MIFIVRNNINNNYVYKQIDKTIENGIVNDKGIPITKEREYRTLENIKYNYPKYVLTLNNLLQQINGIINENIIKFLLKEKIF